MPLDMVEAGRNGEALKEAARHFFDISDGIKGDAVLNVDYSEEGRHSFSREYQVYFSPGTNEHKVIIPDLLDHHAHSDFSTVWQHFYFDGATGTLIINGVSNYTKQPYTIELSK